MIPMNKIVEAGNDRFHWSIRTQNSWYAGSKQGPSCASLKSDRLSLILSYEKMTQPSPTSGTMTSITSMPTNVMKHVCANGSGTKKRRRKSGKL
mmetsp:Transcript_750/g.1577  ORF Transcript_750/g.1577 Transcript_750/m.1577 type:complete len:94 (-) Transcript_750:729-1010(-)